MPVRGQQLNVDPYIAGMVGGTAKRAEFTHGGYNCVVLPLHSCCYCSLCCCLDFCLLRCLANSIYLIAQVITPIALQ